MDQTFDPFRQALRARVEVAWDRMRDTVDEARRSYRVPERGGNVIGSWSAVPTFVWPDSVEGRLLFLPEWHKAVAVALAIPDLRKHLDNLVGTALGTRAFVLNEVAFAFWPPSCLVADWRNGRDSSSGRNAVFDALWLALEEFFRVETFEIVILVPLPGLVCSCAVDLEPDVAITPFSDDERSRLLEREIFIDAFGRPHSQERLPIYLRSGLRRVMRTPKVVGGDIDPAENERLRRLPPRDQQRIARTLAATLQGRVGVLPYVARQTGWNNGGMSLMAGGVAVPWSEDAPNAELRSENAEEVRHAWRIMGNAGFDSVRPLRIAVDRLARLSTRSSPEDMLIDVFVASEVFFHSDRRETGRGSRDGSERRADCAGEWIGAEDHGMGQKAVKALFLRAARLRNAAVHEGEIPTELLEGHRSLDAFVTTFAELMRRALSRAIAESDVPAMPMWKRDAGSEGSPGGE